MTQTLSRAATAAAPQSAVSTIQSMVLRPDQQADARWLKRTGRTREEWAALWQATLLGDSRQLELAFARLWTRPTDETPHIDVAIQADLDRRAIYDYMLASFRATFPTDMIGQDLVEARFETWLQEPFGTTGKSAAAFLRAQIQTRLTQKVVEAIS
ncbi:hypothetical protein [Pararhodobacter sp. CCB-MM2]|uniref:hypothetical protein n=1 Tax=Pararhodobacter sp. CCB-MM2 TaxID=1786003 RepID=UPI000831902C|nr:hypothetical protein [Pararhodobacter sp. CCB-MM2]MCA2011980.1 hypothetical protein [Cereibacter sphaeroides]